MNEYAIWGKPPTQQDETLLLAMPNGKPIINPDEANKLMETLIQTHGCRDCRIQIIDMDKPDISGFVKAVRSTS